eukprot:CAMPEP_0168618738 /NCGR_PEP_ID=MMETSP0449_2-20121227/6230_1 /TAXON_ID=1082188 /ORGANISM="Strombidium rassoulzadegani, Strain ras09" /LENGTH=77 /DNA_ID=CAMNT_0008659629 /DNA_START=128 /DNA_END=361 /DNA_ORIENTATION=+
MVLDYREQAELPLHPEEPSHSPKEMEMLQSRNLFNLEPAEPSDKKEEALDQIKHGADEAKSKEGHSKGIVGDCAKGN